MAECKHENAEHMMPGDASTPDWCVQIYAEFERRNGRRVVKHTRRHLTLPTSRDNSVCDRASMFRLWCWDCATNVSMGPAHAPTDAERCLALEIADVHILWEPGKEREKRIAEAVEFWRGR